MEDIHNINILDDFRNNLNKIMCGLKDKISDEEKVVNLVNSMLSEPLGKLY